MKEGRWAIVPFSHCVDYIHEATRVLAMCIDGLHSLAMRVPLTEAVAAYQASEQGKQGFGDDADHVERARQMAELAQSEIEQDFPLLRAHTIVGVWGALEVLAEDLLVAYLLNEPSVLERPELSKLKVPVVQFELLDRESRMRHLADEIARDQKAALQRGVARFEALFDMIGLSGPVDDGVARDLYELSQVRHVIVHRTCIADAKLLKACPWLQVNEGDRVHIGKGDCDRYLAAVEAYAMCLLERVRQDQGLPHYTQLASRRSEVDCSLGSAEHALTGSQEK